MHGEPEGFNQGTEPLDISDTWIGSHRFVGEAGEVKVCSVGLKDQWKVTNQPLWSPGAGGPEGPELAMNPGSQAYVTAGAVSKRSAMRKSVDFCELCWSSAKAWRRVWDSGGQ